MNEQALAQHVHAGLHALAGPPVGAEEARRAVDAARREAGLPRRRPGRVTVWLAVAAVVVVLAGAGAVRLLLPSPAGTAAPTASAAPITSWPARGDLVDDAGVIAQAQRVWRTGAPADRQPGDTTTTLYAGRVPYGRSGAGATVVMLLSRSGASTLVGIVASAGNPGSAQPERHLILRSVAVVDPATVIRSVGFVAATTPADHPDSLVGAVGYVLLAPGITTGQLQSSMYDSFMTDHPGLPPAPNGLVTYEGAPGSGPWNSWVATPKGTPGTDVLAGGLGDPSYTSGTVSSTGHVASGDGTPVHVGDLVVARDEQPAGDGFLGVVTSAGGGAGADTEARTVTGTPGHTGTIDPSLDGLGGWNLQAMSYGSNYAGTLSRNAAGGLVFTTDQRDAPKGVSRVVVRTTDGSVTVNVGQFAGDPKAGNTTSPFPLEQTDTLPSRGSRPVWIIATGA